MTDLKISELPLLAQGSVKTGDWIPIVDSSENTTKRFNSDLITRSFADLTDFTTEISNGFTAIDGAVVSVGPVQFQADPDANITGLPAGWKPFGNYHLDHWNVTREENTGQGTASGGADNSTAIQAAHDYVASIGGGIIEAGPGVIAFSDPIFWGDGGAPVLLKGEGRGGIANGITGLRSTAGTRFLWMGGDNLVGFTLTGDRADTGMKARPYGGGVEDVMFDGKTKSSIGFKVDSHSGHVLKISLAYWGGDCQFLSDVNDNGFDNAPSDVQRFIWDIRTFNVNTSNEPLSEVVITGKNAGDRTEGIAANTSVGTIRHLSASAESTAVAVRFGNCDALDIQALHAGARVSGVGDGGKILLHGLGTVPAAFSDGTARHNTFVHVQGNVTAKANSGPNTILNYTRGNGVDAPVVETGAVITWFDDDNGLRGNAVQASSVDTSFGKVLVMRAQGPFGLGSAGDQNTLEDLDAFDTPVGTYRTTGDTLNIANRPAGTSNFGYVTIDRHTADTITQYYTDVLGSSLWYRKYRAASGGWNVDWRKFFDTDNLLGTVSQSSGVPTGAIIERGSNANGTYVRFADGTQICNHALLSSSGGPATWTFPAAFSGAIPRTAGASASTSVRIFTLDTPVDSTTTVSFSSYNIGGNRTATTTFLTAVGRWF